MKKLILIITLLISQSVFSQSVDTANFDFLANGFDGKLTLLKNKVTYLDKAPGTVIMPLSFSVYEVNTDNWQLIAIGYDGSFRIVENTTEFYGHDSGTVKAVLMYDLAADSIYYVPNFYGYPYKDSLNTFSMLQTIDSAAINTLSVTGFLNIDDSAVTTSGGTCTLNKLAGVITNSDFVGGLGGTIEMNNSYITASSVVIITGECADYQSISISLGIISMSAGQITFAVIATSGGNFTNDFKIHFLIIN